MKPIRFEDGQVLEQTGEPVELSDDEQFVALSADELEIMRDGLHIGAAQLDAHAEDLRRRFPGGGNSMVTSVVYRSADIKKLEEQAANIQEGLSARVQPQDQAVTK